jgi:rhodanese-related sulfurtransferase
MGVGCDGKRRVLGSDGRDEWECPHLCADSTHRDDGRLLQAGPRLREMVLGPPGGPNNPTLTERVTPRELGPHAVGSAVMAASSPGTGIAVVVHSEQVSRWATSIQTRLAVRSVLHLGSAASERSSQLTAVLAAHDVLAMGIVDVSRDRLVALQLDTRFDLVWLTVPQPRVGSSADPRALVHAAVQHMVPGGVLIIEPDPRGADDVAFSALCAEFDLIDDSANAIDHTLLSFRRTERFTVHDLVFEARSTIRRVSTTELRCRLESTDPPVVIDTRTQTDRRRFGVIDGSIHAPRTVLEWHVDPSNGYRHPAMRSFDQPIVVICNGGYSSSLAAANLVRLGFTDVADLIGGVHAWRAAGLPVATPDHSHLDL